MAVILRSTNLTTTDDFDHAIDLAEGDNLYILQGVTVAALGSEANGVSGPGSSRIEIYGTVISDTSNGIFLEPTGSNHFFVSETGLVSAGLVGISAFGDLNDITNDGSISAGDTGIATSGGSNRITNNGSISAGGNDDFTGTGIFASSVSDDITNNGTISADFIGIVAGGSSNEEIANGGSISAVFDTDIDGIDGGFSRITNGGSISAGFVGIASGGSSDITNGGSISAGLIGIAAFEGSNSITNSGEITATFNGVFIAGSSNKVVNYDTITATGEADSSGILIDSLTGESNTVVNFGKISSQGDGIDGRAGNETVINRGTIEGAVVLGAGTDTYRGAGGVVIGDIGGGRGNDLLIGGRQDDFLLGEFGRDTLRGRAGDDDVSGGDGGDKFQFGRGDATDTVLDFQDDVDTIQLNAASLGVTSVADALAHAQVIAGDTVFRFDTRDVLIVENVTDKALLSNDLALTWA